MNLQELKMVGHFQSLLAPVLADGIGAEGLLILGAIYFIIPAACVVLIEAAVLWPFARIGFRRSFKVALWANLASFVAGIPLMIWFAVLSQRMVRPDLHVYFDDYLRFCLIKYAAYFAISVLVETIVVVWLLWRVKVSRLRVIGAVLLGNVLTYAGICPAHYYGMRPTYQGERFTADSNWAPADSGKLLYLDAGSRQLMSIDANGRNHGLVFANAMTYYIVSRDLSQCLYIGGDRFYYIKQGMNMPQGIGPAYTRKRFPPTATADFSPSGGLVAYVITERLPKSFHYSYELHLVDIAAKKDIVIDKGAEVPEVPEVYWTDQERQLWLRFRDDNSNEPSSYQKLRACE